MSQHIDKVVVMGNDIDRLGGIGRFMHRLSLELFNRGHTVELVGVAPAPAGHYQPMDRPQQITERTLMSSQIPEAWTLKTLEHRLNPARRLRYSRRMRLRREAVDKLRELLPQWGPNTVIICTQVYGMEHMIEAGYDPANPQHPRVIGQYHGSAREAKAIGDMRRVLQSYTGVDRFICLSAADAQEFAAAGLNNVGWIANPVALPTHDAPARRKVFASLGRYDKIKSLDYFLRAWASVADQLPEWSAELYGEGPEREALESLIRELKIPRVTLMGKTDDVGNALSSSSVHILSSQNEGLPIAIVEAGLLGVPSVAFDCAPGVHDLIDDQVDGFIVTQNSVAELADRMRALAQDDTLLSAFSQRIAESSKRYLPENVVAQWEEELRELTF